MENSSCSYSSLFNQSESLFHIISRNKMWSKPTISGYCALGWYAPRSMPHLWAGRRASGEVGYRLSCLHYRSVHSAGQNEPPLYFQCAYLHLLLPSTWLEKAVLQAGHWLCHAIQWDGQSPHCLVIPQEKMKKREREPSTHICMLVGIV